MSASNFTRILLMIRKTTLSLYFYKENFLQLVINYKISCELLGNFLK